MIEKFDRSLDTSIMTSTTLVVFFDALIEVGRVADVV